MHRSEKTARTTGIGRMPPLTKRVAFAKPGVLRVAALMLVTTLSPVAPVAAQQPVSPGGAGSYASFVPAAQQEVDGYYGLTAAEVTGDGSLSNFVKLAPSLAGSPLQTNRWWSDLLAGNRSTLYTVGSGVFEHVLSQGKPTDDLSGLYGGQMWFYPGMLVPRSYGFDLYYPVSWKNDPTNATVDAGPALQIRGDRGYAVPPDDVVVADFETSYPSGWTVSSFAGYPNPFTSMPAQASWGHGLSGAIGNGRVDSYVGAPNQASDNYRGMISGTFTAQKHYLNLLVGGGNDPAHAYVDLKDAGGNVLYRVTGQQDTTLRWTTWDLSAYAGQTLTLEIVDNSSAAYGFIACDQIVQSDSNAPATRYGTDLFAQKSVVTGWGDWNVDFELADSSGLATDVTMARGIPFTWSTWKNGLKPKLMGLGGVQLVDAGGNAISAAPGSSFAASAFAFNYQGRAFGVFLPDNTTVAVNADGSLEPQLAGANNYLVVGYLPATSSLAEFAQYAYARPTDTKLSWSYNPADGYVATYWNIATQALKGSNLNTIQGWLPHHYRTTGNSLAFRPYTYLTATGTMKCAVGNSFALNFPFHGIAPVLPAPASTGAANDFQPARMQAYLSGFNPGALVGGDTYNAGKSLGVASQLMSEAAQMGDTADFNRLKSIVETSLADWFTYTPGEENNAGGAFGFFARYDDWHALVGFNPSYGTQTFNDLHFHYGYFIRSLALVGMYDQAFLNNYAPMARAIVKSYNNYDRTDTSEPFLRMFDVWEGHCNAGGLSGSTGENQESSSEAVQSWTGMFLLGGVLGDQQMTAAGAMGYAMETASTNEYWQDIAGTNRPSTYTKGIAGQVWGGHTSYTTFFTADPAWVYGIQYVPASHTLGYLTRYQTTQQLQNTWNTMWSERESWANSFVTWDASTDYLDTNTHHGRVWVKYNSKVYSPNNDVPAGHAAPDQNPTDWYYQGTYGRTEPDVVDNGLSPYLIAYQALFDPDTAAAEFDRYYAASESITQGGTGATDYYLIHALRQVGQQDDSAYTSIPTSAVYYNPKTGKHSYVVYNPSTTQQNVTIYQNGAAVGTFPVPAQTTIDSHLDETLARLVLTPATAATVVPPGQTLQFNAVGYDQYGATYPLSNVQWTASAGGTISAGGLFTATTNANPVTVTASVGGFSQSYSFRVGPAPVLSAINLTPGFTRVVNGTTQQYGAAGVDQYGSPYTLGSVNWTFSNASVGAINSAGLFSASAVGTGYITYSSGSVSGSTLVAVHAPPANVALHCQAYPSSQPNGNVANNVTDGNTTSTRWESTQTDNQSIYIDLGKVYDLSSITINWETAYAATYDVEVATDLTAAQPWTPVTSTQTNPTGLRNPVNTVPLANATGRYLKLGLFTRASGYGFSIYEISVYGYPNAASITPTVVQVSPASVGLTTGQQAQFQAYAFNANADGGPTTATWSVSGDSISSAGLFSGTTAGGPFTVTAALGSLSGTASVTVTDPPSNLTNVALNQAATASSVENSGCMAGYAVDGNATGTRWSSAPADGESLTVDLGQSIALSRVSILWENAYGKQYKIVGSNDGNAWTPLAFQTNGQGGTDTFNVSGSYRYVRMQGIQRGTGYGYSIWEFQVFSYNAPQRVNKALNKTATASSSQNGGLTPNYAVDGDATTRWSSGATDDETLTVNLGTPTAVSQVVLKWENAYGKQYNIRGSNDGNVWTPLAGQTNGQGGTDTFNVAGTYQYIQMQGVQRGTGYGYSLWEIQIY